MAALVTPADVLAAADSSWFAAQDATAAAVPDRLGNSNLTAAGAPTVDDGFVTHAATSAAYISAAEPTHLTGSTATQYLAGWFRINEVTTSDFFVSLSTATTNNRRIFLGSGAGNGVLGGHYPDDGTTLFSTVTPFSTVARQWVFIEYLVDCDAGTQAIYVNGRLAVSTVAAAELNTAATTGIRLCIGGINAAADSQRMTWRHVYLSETIPNAEQRAFLYTFEDPRTQPLRTPRDVLRRARASWLTYGGATGGLLDVLGHGTLAVTNSPTVADQTVTMTANNQQYLGSANPTWLATSTTQQYIGAWLRLNTKDASTQRYFFGVYYSAADRRWSLRRINGDDDGYIGLALSADGSAFWVDAIGDLPLGKWVFFEALVDTAGSAATRMFFNMVAQTVSLDEGTRGATLFTTATTNRLQVGGITGTAGCALFSFRHAYFADYLPTEAERRFLMTYDPPPGALAP